MTVNTLMGVKQVNYVSKKDNMPRMGYELHYQYDDPAISGVGCGSCYIAGRNVNVPDLVEGFQFYVLYNQFGRVDGYLPVDKK